MMEKKMLDEKKINIAYFVNCTIMVLVIVTSVIQFSYWELAGLTPANIRDISIDMVAMALSGVLLFSLASDRPRDKQNRMLFRLIFTLGSLFFFQFCTCYMEGHVGFTNVVRLLYTMLYFNETLLLYCFWSYIREELGSDGHQFQIANLICRAMLLVDLVVDVLNLKYGFVFTVDAKAKIIPGAFEDAAEITTFVIFLLCWFLIITAKDRRWNDKLVLLTFQVFPLIAKIVTVISEEYVFELPSYLIATLIIFISVFYRRGRKVLEQQIVLEDQRTTLMISQIQPHFLYNVLTTISNLCVTDPEEAEETTILFAQYLRTNLDSLRQSAPVPFQAELGHIRTYVELEKKRFGEKLNVTFDCPECGFLVPSLGLQPIVENSIKHGIRGKDSPGHLWVTSRRVDGGFEVEIKDDGVGFDPEAPAPDDGRSHVGMVNVRSRLALMCNARVSVESSPGNGCRTTIFFPEDEDLEL